MMGAWDYVFLAYGIVWGAILVYLMALKRRYRRAENELAQLSAAKDSFKHESK